MVSEEVFLNVFVGPELRDRLPDFRGHILQRNIESPPFHQTLSRTCSNNVAFDVNNSTTLACSGANSIDSSCKPMTSDLLVGEEEDKTNKTVPFGHTSWKE